MPEIMIPLVGTVEGDGATRRRIVRRSRRRGLRREGVQGRVSGRHHDRVAARRAHRRRDRRGSRVLQLRHQRPHPDDLRLLARRRQQVPAGLPRERHPRARPVPVLDREGVGELVQIGVERGPPDHVPTSRSASAANTAASPRASSSSTPSAWTTSPARRSACSSRVWRPRKPQPARSSRSKADGRNSVTLPFRNRYVYLP